MKENSIIYGRITKAYSLKVVLREISLIAAIYIFNRVFPAAFDMLGYPFYLMFILVVTGFIIYLPMFLLIKKHTREFDKNLTKIARLDKDYFFINNLIIGSFMPAFGTQFINIFWFVTAINCCSIFVSPFIGKRGIYTAILSPIYALVIHYLIYYPQGKDFQPIEIGFSLLMCFVFGYTYSSISQKKFYDRLLFSGESLVEKFSIDYKLTEREREVFNLMLEGKSTKQIGLELYISPGTARNHISNIFQKTGTHSRMELLSEFNRSA